MVEKMVESDLAARRRLAPLTQPRRGPVSARSRLSGPHGSRRHPPIGRGAARALPRCSPASTSTSRTRYRPRGPRPERRRQDEPPAPRSRGSCRCAAAPGTVLGCDLSGDRRALRRQVGLLGHRPSFYPRALRGGEPRLRPARAARGPAGSADAALERVGLTAEAGHRRRRARCPRASSVAWGSRGWSRAAHRSGCSTSRARASTPTVARCATSSSRTPRAGAPRSCSRATTPCGRVGGAPTCRAARRRLRRVVADGGACPRVA